LRRANETGTSKETGIFMGELFKWNRFGFGRYVLVDTTQTKFLSCYSEAKVQFTMYFQPFHEYVWITIFAFCSIIALMFSVFNRKLNLSKSFNPFFFFISTLVEEPYSVPNVIWNNSFFKSITWTSILLAMVFTNLYSGTMISEVTAPLPGEILKDFDQVMNTKQEFLKLKELDYYQITEFWLNNYTTENNLSADLDKFEHSCDSGPSFDSKRYDLHHEQFRDKDSFSLLQAPVESCLGERRSNAQYVKYLSHPWIYSGVNYVDNELSQYWNGDDEAYSKRLVAFFSPRNRYYPKDPKFSVAQIRDNPHYLSSAIEKELVACQKSIFMGDKKDLVDEKLYLKINYPRKSFYMSDEAFEIQRSKPIIWKFVNGGKSKVPYYFQRLIESGVRQGILGLRKQEFYLRRRIGTKDIQKSIRIEINWGIAGSIQTLFFILIGFLSVSLAVFSVELVYGNTFFRFLYQTWIQNVNYLVSWVIHFKIRSLRALVFRYVGILLTMLLGFKRNLTEFLAQPLGLYDCHVRLYGGSITLERKGLEGSNLVCALLIQNKNSYQMMDLIGSPRAPLAF
jgi:hypothetical protein